MLVSVFFSIHPVGQSDSVGDEVAQAVDIIKDSGLEHEVGPSGTTILGEWDEVMAVVKRCHQALGEDGGRLNSVLKVDWHPNLDPGDVEGKVQRVEERLEA